MQPGEIVRLRYATKVSSSNQGRGVRQVRVLEGEHEDSRFQRGPIITVEDLSDPHNPGQVKNLYVHRISDVEGMSDGDSDNNDDAIEDAIEDGDEPKRDIIALILATKNHGALVAQTSEDAEGMRWAHIAAQEKTEQKAKEAEQRAQEAAATAASAHEESLRKAIEEEAKREVEHAQLKAQVTKLTSSTTAQAMQPQVATGQQSMAIAMTIMPPARQAFRVCNLPEGVKTSWLSKQPGYQR